MDLFISHCSGDAIAKRFADLVQHALYPDDEDAFIRSVFFTSSDQNGLRAGEDFGKMLKKLDEAKVVIGIVTLRTAQSCAMQAEMALARHQEKLLPVVARSDYQRRLTWPFAGIHAPALDSATQTLELLRDLAARFGRPFKNEKEIRVRCDAVAEFAKRQCPLPSPPRTKWWWIAPAFVVLLPLAAYAGYRYALPTLYYLHQGEEAQVDGVSVKLLFQGTFPRKFLVRRLTQLRQGISEPGADEVKRKAHTLEAQALFLEALAAGAATWRLSSSELDRLGAIVKEWNGDEDYGSTKKPQEEPKDPLNGEPARPVCGDVKLPLDIKWCQVINSPQKDDASFGSKFDARAFDRTAFAVAAIDGKRAALVTGGVPDRKTWRVRGFGTMVIEVK